MFALAVPLIAQEKGAEPREFVSITKEQAATIRAGISAVDAHELRRQLELEKVKTLVLSLQIILKLGPEWEFDLDEMKFKKAEEKKPATEK